MKRNPLDGPLSSLVTVRFCCNSFPRKGLVGAWARGGAPKKWVYFAGPRNIQRETDADPVQSNPGANKALTLATKPFAPDDEAALREALKRCSPSTFEAAVQFRKTGNADHMPAVVIGVIERFVEPDLRAKLRMRMMTCA